MIAAIAGVLALGLVVVAVVTIAYLVSELREARRINVRIVDTLHSWQDAYAEQARCPFCGPREDAPLGYY